MRTSHSALEGDGPGHVEKLPAATAAEDVIEPSGSTKCSPIDLGGHPLGKIEECAQPGNDTEDKIQALIRTGADEVLLRTLITALWMSCGSSCADAAAATMGRGILTREPHQAVADE